MTAGEVVQLLGQSVSGVVAIAMLALFITGQIVPRSRIDEMKDDLAAMREERDEWKRAAQVNQQIASVQTQTSQIVRDVMQGLRKEIEP